MVSACAATRQRSRRATTVAVGAAQRQRAGVGVDAAGAGQGDGAAIAVGARDIAQGAAAGDPGAVEGQGLGADGDVVLDLQRRPAGHGRAAGGGAERGVV